ncbi:hypothetical protein N7520_008837 [Penicillium odoratum]|uniref:uncharacterized protein n=1 Tax=Penicillium odoratum TaxID=1167516 RepID=UPI00254957DB|nr:uncharacterized protein N7520_008837 [Penicillium odoratum]KAJ5751920.1 hypothetical protein N7520_008837 [Penicillium odoratum]
MFIEYGEFESKGSALQRQMENTEEPGCLIPRSTATRLGDLSQEEWKVIAKKECLPSEFVSCFHLLGLPADTNPDEESSPYRCVYIVRREFPAMSWVGRVGEGVILLDCIKRSNGNRYHMSDLTKLAYERYFPLDTLRFVIAACVVNTDSTMTLFEIYRSRGIYYLDNDEYTWESSAAEFRALLGCGIGKCVTNFILAAYGQGVKRISRIVTWRERGELEMLFAIENVV